MKDLLRGISLIHQAKPGGIKPVKKEENTAKFAFASVLLLKISSNLYRLLYLWIC